MNKPVACQDVVGDQGDGHHIKIGDRMNLEIHRRDEAADSEVRMTKVFKRWLTSDQYEEIPLDEAEVLSNLLIETLPLETLAELTRRLNEFASKKKG